MTKEHNSGILRHELSLSLFSPSLEYRVETLSVPFTPQMLSDLSCPSGSLFLSLTLSQRVPKVARIVLIGLYCLVGMTVWGEAKGKGYQFVLESE